MFWKNWRERKRNRGPERDPTALSNILIHLGLVTVEQAQEAFKKKHDTLIGQVFLQERIITQDQLDEALFQQALKRGKVSHRKAVLHTLERQEKSQTKLNEGYSRLAAATQNYIETGKFAPIKRSS